MVNSDGPATPGTSESSIEKFQNSGEEEDVVDCARIVADSNQQDYEQINSLVGNKTRAENSKIDPVRHYQTSGPIHADSHSYKVVIKPPTSKSLVVNGKTIQGSENKEINFENETKYVASMKNSTVASSSSSQYGFKVPASVNRQLQNNSRGFKRKFDQEMPNLLTLDQKLESANVGPKNAHFDVVENNSPGLVQSLEPLSSHQKVEQYLKYLKDKNENKMKTNVFVKTDPKFGQEQSNSRQNIEIRNASVNSPALATHQNNGQDLKSRNEIVRQNGNQINTKPQNGYLRGASPSSMKPPTQSQKQTECENQQSSVDEIVRRNVEQIKAKVLNNAQKLNSAPEPLTISMNPSAQSPKSNGNRITKDINSEQFVRLQEVPQFRPAKLETLRQIVERHKRVHGTSNLIRNSEESGLDRYELTACNENAQNGSGAGKQVEGDLDENNKRETSSPKEFAKPIGPAVPKGVRNAASSTRQMLLRKQYFRVELRDKMLHRRLANIGNSCYMNATLQALSSMGAFMGLVKKNYNYWFKMSNGLEMNRFISRRGDTMKLKFLVRFCEALLHLKDSTATVRMEDAKLEELRNLFGQLYHDFNNDEQQDAHEYLDRLMMFFNEVKREFGITMGREDIPTKEIVSWVESRFCCTNCNHERTQQPTEMLNIGVSLRPNKKLQELFNNAFPCTFNPDLKCEICNKRGSKMSQKINEVQGHLILNLKRYKIENGLPRKDTQTTVHIQTLLYTSEVMRHQTEIEFFDEVDEDSDELDEAFKMSPMSRKRLAPLSNFKNDECAPKKTTGIPYTVNFDKSGAMELHRDDAYYNGREMKNKGGLDENGNIERVKAVNVETEVNQVVEDEPNWTLANGFPVFRLVAVVCHEGNAFDSGHYVAYTRNFFGKWTFSSDDDVKEVPLSEVLEKVSKEGYVFYYSKIDPNNPDDL